MTTPEQHDPAKRWVSHQPERTGPKRGPGGKKPAPPEGVREPETLVVNEAIAETVRTAYDVLNDTVKQGRKAAEQFRGGTYNVRDVPDDVRVVHVVYGACVLAEVVEERSVDRWRQCDELNVHPNPKRNAGADGNIVSVDYIPSGAASVCSV